MSLINDNLEICQFRNRYPFLINAFDISYVMLGWAEEAVLVVVVVVVVGIIAFRCS